MLRWPPVYLDISLERHTMLKEKERGIDPMENRKGDITIDTKKVHCKKGWLHAT